MKSGRLRLGAQVKYKRTCAVHGPAAPCTELLSFIGADLNLCLVQADEEEAGYLSALGCASGQRRTEQSRWGLSCSPEREVKRSCLLPWLEGWEDPRTLWKECTGFRVGLEGGGGGEQAGGGRGCEEGQPRGSVCHVTQARKHQGPGGKCSKM